MAEREQVIQLLPKRPIDYLPLLKDLNGREESQRKQLMRELCRNDLYFLLRYALNRPDVENQWLLDRCREVQKDPDDRLDLWSREHYKSTVITFALTIQDILKTHGDDVDGREITVGIFSHTRPSAKSFLRQIKREFESNKLLLDLFPDVLYENPQKDSPKWSEDEGIIVKRKSNQKEATVEAWGLVDGQPIGKHFSLLVYDDIVTLHSVATPDMIAKTTEALGLSYNLGADNGARRFIGTRYHYNDTYKTIIDRGTVVKRIHPATSDGTFDGDPVLWTKEKLATKIRDMGSYTAACQLMQDPKQDSAQGFKEEWINYFKPDTSSGLNVYLLCDPASEKKKSSDYTAMLVIGLGADTNYYLLDMVYDKLNLTERTAKLFNLHKKWKPIRVGYEKYGKDSDISHIKYIQDTTNYHFEIVELGGITTKNDRIKRLIPVFEQGRFYLPESLQKQIYDGRLVELISQFINDEYLAFPVGLHDDAIDCMARILDADLCTSFPMEWAEPERYRSKKSRGSSWAT